MRRGNELSELLEIGAHAVTAILATWLGLLVITRAGRTSGAPVFSVLCLLLVTWCAAIIVQRVDPHPAIVPTANMFEDVAAFLLPPATTHIALTVAFERRRSALATSVIVVGYGIAALAIVQAALDPAHPIGFSEPWFAPLGIRGDLVAWAFALARLTVWSFGIGYLVAGLRQAGEDNARRRQLQVAIATVVLGVIGGMLRILPEEVGGPRWIGVSLVAAATVLATYAILAQHLFVAADVAARAVRGSVLAGLGIVAYVAALVLLERGTAAVLGIDVPLVTALAVVVTIALFEPVAERVRRLTAGNRGVDRARLTQALGGGTILAQAPGRSVEPALSRLVRTFELAGATVVDDQEVVRAAVGTVDPEDRLAIRLELGADQTTYGHVVFGRKRNDLPFTASEQQVLGLAADYLASTLHLGERHEEQMSALATLRAERRSVESRGTALSAALADAAETSDDLHVYALGSLRAERGGEAIRQWGGEKAGSRQAEAVFAFLFDRGDRGVSKDEILELVWPDVDLDRADVAFHRTMLGLRSVLHPGRARGAGGPITFHNDRYRLDPSLVAWSDVAEFDRLVAEAAAASEPDQALRALEQARALYRGDYLDDCPFFGDSAAVEERRGELRERYVDVLVELGERYAERDERTVAASCLRQAQALAEVEVPRVTAALARLMAPPATEPSAAPAAGSTA